MHGGDLLTLGRLAAAPIYAWTFGRALANPRWGWLAVALFVFACVSDVYDGRLARRAGRASARGRMLDAIADIAFLLSALVAAAWAGVTPWWVPASIGASFAYYVVDSWLLTRESPGPQLIASRLGHWGGVANFVVAGVVTFNEAFGLKLLPGIVLMAIYATVPLYSGAAVIARLGLWRSPEVANHRKGT